MSERDQSSGEAYTVLEAAAKARRSVGTIRRWIRSGDLKANKPGGTPGVRGGKWNIDPLALDEFLTQGHSRG